MQEAQKQPIEAPVKPKEAPAVKEKADALAAAAPGAPATAARAEARAAAGAQAVYDIDDVATQTPRKEAPSSGTKPPTLAGRSSFEKGPGETRPAAPAKPKETVSKGDLDALLKQVGDIAKKGNPALEKIKIAGTGNKEKPVTGNRTPASYDMDDVAANTPRQEAPRTPNQIKEEIAAARRKAKENPTQVANKPRKERGAS